MRTPGWIVFSLMDMGSSVAFLQEYATGAGGAYADARIELNMSTVNSSFDYEAENERQRRMAEEDRHGFFMVVVAAGIAMFVMLLFLMAVLLVAGQRVMPLHSHHLVANSLLVWPVAEAGQGTGWHAAG